MFACERRGALSRGCPRRGFLLRCAMPLHFPRSRVRLPHGRHHAACVLALGVGLIPDLARCAVAASPPDVRLASFTADVTVPVGHGMMGGAWRATRIADPLQAHGLVLLGDGRPVVFVAVDWCEIRNDALARWQSVLAAAADTDPERVMVSAVHQHDAPVANLEAELALPQLPGLDRPGMVAL